LGANLLKWNERFHNMAFGWLGSRGQTGAARILDLHIQMVHERAFLAYRPMPYKGKITLIRPPGRPPGYEVEPDLGWGVVALGGVEVHEVSGAHLTIFSNENVSRLAAKVDECIRLALLK